MEPSVGQVNEAERTWVGGAMAPDGLDSHSHALPSESHVTDAKRSRIMRAVRREKTTPELAVARFLGAHGVRFRTNVRSLPGSPDLANKSRRFAVYVHGCFWHRHPGCRRATTPKDNAGFWRTKFEQNVARDRRKEQALRDLGFEVAVVWECETRDEGQLWRALVGVLAKARAPSGRDVARR